MVKACVILGAGASYDVHGEGSSYHSSDPNAFRPPLAKDLFDINAKPQYRQILRQYPGADHLTQVLAPKCQHDDFNVEQELHDFANHPEPQTRENFKEIPAYLRDLLYKCSRDYTDVPSCYNQLVHWLLSQHRHEVLFLILNYDDLLEQALKMYNGGLYTFHEVEAYVRDIQAAKVVKLHGSIDWFKRLSGQSGGWFARLRDTGIDQLQAKGHVLVRPGIPQIVQHNAGGGNLLYPILTAPLAGKGITAAVCPDTHIAVAEEFLRDCRKFLIIGSSGLDDDLMDLLNRSIPADLLPMVHLVDTAAVHTVKERFLEKVTSFKQAITEFPTQVFDRGFRLYLSDGGIDPFARAFQQD